MHPTLTIWEYMMSENLLAITYSEFDNKVGPKLKYSYPPEVLPNEVFESFSEYVIMPKQLCEKIIVVVGKLSS